MQFSYIDYYIPLNVLCQDPESKKTEAKASRISKACDFFMSSIDFGADVWYNECKAFIIIYLNALADTQNKVLLPAYRAIIP